MNASQKLSRRCVLRGIVGGSAVSVALPFLDCFLNLNGTALADGRPLPIRFGTWFWGLGFTPGRWTPTTLGANYDLPPELQAIEKYRSQINILSGFNALLDGRPNLVHVSGNYSIRSGVAPAKEKMEATTLDVLIANQIGAGTRFSMLNVAASGNRVDSYSYQSSAVRNTPEVSPSALYSRVFGADFQDPNAAEFKPDPAVLSRRSVLSVVKEQRKDLVKRVGADDRARLDQYFTSVRELEQQLDLQLQKPEPAAACIKPESPPEAGTGYELGEIGRNHELLAQLLSLALACNQTKVFNVVFSNSASSLHKAGGPSSHHLYTHEEITDAKLGYQAESSTYVEANMQAWARFVEILASVPEGGGTLLDNCLVFAHSDTSFAKIHAVQGVPMMTAGKAGGRIRTGLHVDSNGDAVTRVGLTMQQVMGVLVDNWGTGSMNTSKPVSEIVV